MASNSTPGSAEHTEVLYSPTILFEIVKAPKLNFRALRDVVDGTSVV